LKRKETTTTTTTAAAAAATTTTTLEQKRKKKVPLTLGLSSCVFIGTGCGECSDGSVSTAFYLDWNKFA